MDYEEHGDGTYSYYSEELQARIWLPGTCTMMAKNNKTTSELFAAMNKKVFNSQEHMRRTLEDAMFCHDLIGTVDIKPPSRWQRIQMRLSHIRWRIVTAFKVLVFGECGCEDED